MKNHMDNLTDIESSAKTKAIKTAAIILAAGRGRRMGGTVSKQFLLLNKKPIIYYSLKAFEDSPIDEIILVTGEDDIAYCKKEIIEPGGFRKVTAVVGGGAERYHSVYAGLQSLSEKSYRQNGYVLIHDGARPFVDIAIINNALAEAVRFGAAAVGMPVKDTIKIADADGFAKLTPRRSDTWMIQTPQVFFYPLIVSAYDKLMSREEYRREITDDAMVVETMTEHPVKLTKGSYENIKVTTPEDMEIATAILSRRTGKSTL